MSRCYIGCRAESYGTSRQFHPRSLLEKTHQLCTQQCMACKYRARRHEGTLWPIGRTHHRYDWALSRCIEHCTSVMLIMDWERKEVRGAKRIPGAGLRNIVAFAKVCSYKWLLASLDRKYYPYAEQMSVY